MPTKEQIDSTREIFVDCTGRERVFKFHLMPRSPDKCVEISAREINIEDQRYSFLARDVTIDDCMERLRTKIRKSLATRHIVWMGEERGMMMTHDKLCGEVLDHGVVVDGYILPWDTLRTLFAEREGENFEITFSPITK